MYCCGEQAYNLKNRQMKCCAGTLYNLTLFGKLGREAQCCGAILQKPQVCLNINIVVVVVMPGQYVLLVLFSKYIHDLKCSHKEEKI